MSVEPDIFEPSLLEPVTAGSVAAGSVAAGSVAAGSVAAGSVAGGLFVGGSVSAEPGPLEPGLREPVIDAGVMAEPAIDARVRTSAWLAAGMAMAGLLVVVMRVAQLQAAPDPRLGVGPGRGVASWTVQTPRGDLLDREGRVLATSRFVSQPIVDPEGVPWPPDGWIVRASALTGVPSHELGRAVLGAMAKNDARLGRSRDAASGRAGARRTGGEGWSAGLSRIAAALGRRFGGGGAGPGAQEAMLTEAGAQAQPEGEDEPAGPTRYLPVGGPVGLEAAAAIRAARLPGLTVERRMLRERVSADVMAGLAPVIGLLGADKNGTFGAERLFAAELSDGLSRVSLVRDARGRPLWAERGSFEPGERGQDVRLSADLVLQRIALEELERGVEEADAAGGRLIAIDPRTGEIVAMADVVREVEGAEEYPWIDARVPRGQGRLPAGFDQGPRRRYRVLEPRGELADAALARPRCLTDQYEPGSTFKSLVFATAHDLGLVAEDERITTPAGGYRVGRRLITDVTRQTEFTWDEVLTRSSNIGMVMIGERMSREQLWGVATRLGFGRPTGLGLGAEASGAVTRLRDWSAFTQTSVSMGYEIAVTPAQMVRAFSALARTGDRAGTLVSLTLRAVGSEDEPRVTPRVFTPEAVARVRRALVPVVEAMDAAMRRADRSAPEPRYTLFGKSGTAKIAVVPPAGKRRPVGAPGYFDRQYNSSFIAAGPGGEGEEPALVVLCVIDDPGPARVRAQTYYGSHVAGPVVRRFFERALPYLGVPPPDRHLGPEEAPELAPGARPSTGAANGAVALAPGR